MKRKRGRFRFSPIRTSSSAPFPLFSGPECEYNQFSMPHGALIYIVALLVAASAALLSGAYAWRFRRTSVGRALAGLMTCALFYALGYALELTSGSLSSMLFWNKIQYLGIALEKGIWYWVHIIYTNAILVIGNAFLVLVWWRSPRPRRRQAAILVAGSARRTSTISSGGRTRRWTRPRSRAAVLSAALTNS